MTSPNIDTTTTTTAVTETTTAAPSPPVRRFPPPCWTQEEALALIEAYRERWYALRRGYLRTADWDAVAAAVTSRCPDASPPKTSAQCRHKMEKLRQRYRAEKQRSLVNPNGRFFSSWFFYDNMDAMENNTTVSAIRSNYQINEQPSGGGDGYAMKTIIDHSLLKLKINNVPKDDIRSHTNLMLNNHGVVGRNSDKSNYGSRIPNGYSPYMAMGYEQPHDGEFGSSVRMKAKRFNGSSNNAGFDCDEGSEYNGSGNGNGSDGFHHVRNMMGGVSSSRRTSYCGGNVEMNNDSRFSSPGVSRLGKKGVKRGRVDPMEEMVLSIKLLGEGFMKMEKMKMEMAQEVEQMRMEMEMKRNEVILESQKQIVEAFVKVLSEVNKNNKNVKTVSPDES